MPSDERFEIVLMSGDRSKVNYLNSNWREAIMHFLRRAWGQDPAPEYVVFEKITFGGVTITRDLSLGMYVGSGNDSGMPVHERADLVFPDHQVVINVRRDTYDNIQGGLARLVYCMEMRRLTLRWDEDRWIEFSKGRSRGELYVRAGAFDL